jgi:hypothetical protein
MACRDALRRLIPGALLLLAALAHAQAGLFQEITVERFDQHAAWRVTAESTTVEVHAQLRYLSGGPDASTHPDEQRVLGIKFRANAPTHARVVVRPFRPIPVGEHSVVTVSVWVQAHNYRHRLTAVLRDADGAPLGTAQMGTMNHMGWRRMTVQLPPLPPGVLFDGFIIEAGPLDVGPGWIYYYFDDITAVVSTW